MFPSELYTAVQIELSELKKMLNNLYFITEEFLACLLGQKKKESVELERNKNEFLKNIRDVSMHNMERRLTVKVDT